MTALIKWLPSPADYAATWAAMRAFTDARTPDTPDEIWLCEHAAVYTLGQASKPEHLLNTNAIPVVQTDRGGQVTFHGPGQVVAYPLVDLRRANLFVKEYVRCLEDAAIDLLADYGIVDACRVAGAPGVYVPRGLDAYAKVAAVGLKVRQGCAYHGLALNVAMDLTPYLGINPCGMAGLSTLDMNTCLADPARSPIDVGNRLAARIMARLYRQNITCASLLGDATLPAVQSRVSPPIQSTFATALPFLPNQHA